MLALQYLAVGHDDIWHSLPARWVVRSVVQ
jgi:hypothetical protein